MGRNSFSTLPASVVPGLLCDAIHASQRASPSKLGSLPAGNTDSKLEPAHDMFLSPSSHSRSIYSGKI